MSKKKIEHTLFDGDRLIKKSLPLKKLNNKAEKPAARTTGAKVTDDKN